MREYGKIECKFWGWARRNELSEDAKLLALYLLSSPHSNSIGCYEIGLGYITTDLKWDMETAKAAFAELSSDRVEKPFAYHCERTDHVFICDHLEHNKPANPKVATSMARLIENIPLKFTYWPDFIKILLANRKHFSDGFINGISNRMGYQEQEQEQEHTLSGSELSGGPLPNEATPETPDEAVEENEGSGGREEPKEDLLHIPAHLRREAKPKPTDLIAAFDRIRKEVWGENMARGWPNQTDHSTAQQWVENGITLDLFEGTIGPAMAAMHERGDEPPQLLKFFQRSIAGAIDQAKKPMPEGFPERKGTARAVIGLHADAETNRLEGLVKGYFADGFWPATEGDNPDGPDCQAPKELIEKYRPDEAATK